MSAQLAAIAASAVDGRTEYLRYRTEQLAKLYDALSASKESILSALNISTGRAPVESQLELCIVLNHVKELFIASDFRSVEKEKLKNRKEGVIRKPKGLIVVIGHKSTPLASVLLPLASAIAAGNAVVSLLADISHLNVVLLSVLGVLDKFAYGFFPNTPESLESVLPHHPLTVFASSELSEDQKILFAKHSITVLRPPSPGASVIVDREHSVADLQRIAQLIVRGKYFGLGCLPGSIEHVLVESTRANELVELLREETLRAFGTNVALSSDYGRLDGKEGARLGQLVAQEAASGAKVILGGNEKAKGLFEPTIVEDASDVLVRSTIKGPVLPVRKFVSLEAALALQELKPTSTVYVFASKVNATFFESELGAQQVYLDDIPIEALVVPSPAAYSPELFTDVKHVVHSHPSPSSTLLAPFTSAKLSTLAALFPREHKLRIVRPMHSPIILRSFFPQGLFLMVGSVALVVLSGLGVGVWKVAAWAFKRYTLV